jgi:hypothetical protein
MTDDRTPRSIESGSQATSTCVEAGEGGDEEGEARRSAEYWRGLSPRVPDTTIADMQMPLCPPAHSCEHPPSRERARVEHQGLIRVARLARPAPELPADRPPILSLPTRIAPSLPGRPEGRFWPLAQCRLSLDRLPLFPVQSQFGPLARCPLLRKGGEPNQTRFGFRFGSQFGEP